MNFSIVIPTRNRCTSLLRTLYSLKGVDFDLPCFEIIVVNNNSEDSTASELCKLQSQFPNLRIELEKNLGPSFARNHGIVSAKFKHIIFLDDDSLIEKDFLKRYERVWLENPKARLIGGRVLAVLENKFFTRRQKFFLKKWGWCFSDVSLGNKAKVLGLGESLCSANLSLRKGQKKEWMFNTQLGISTFDQTLLGSEDSELSIRINLSKQKVLYDPSLLVKNVVEECRFTSKYLIQRFWLLGREMRIMDTILKKDFIEYKSIYLTVLDQVFGNLMRLKFRSFVNYFSDFYNWVTLFGYLLK
jgi:glucosyl-dolichyl phosphate glucuronosyltransferase